MEDEVEKDMVGKGLIKSRTAQLPWVSPFTPKLQVSRLISFTTTKTGALKKATSPSSSSTLKTNDEKILS